jgi:hypothetical protein
MDKHTAADAARRNMLMMRRTLRDAYEQDPNDAKRGRNQPRDRQQMTSEADVLIQTQPVISGGGLLTEKAHEKVSPPSATLVSNRQNIQTLDNGHQQLCIQYAQQYKITRSHCNKCNLTTQMEYCT